MMFKPNTLIIKILQSSSAVMTVVLFSVDVDVAVTIADPEQSLSIASAESW